MKKSIAVMLVLLCLLMISAVSAASDTNNTIASSDITDNTITHTEDSGKQSTIDTLSETEKTVTNDEIIKELEHVDYSLIDDSFLNKAFRENMLDEKGADYLITITCIRYGEFHDQSKCRRMLSCLSPTGPSAPDPHSGPREKTSRAVNI